MISLRKPSRSGRIRQAAPRGSHALVGRDADEFQAMLAHCGFVGCSFLRVAPVEHFETPVTVASGQRQALVRRVLDIGVGSRVFAVYRIDG